MDIEEVPVQQQVATLCHPPASSLFLITSLTRAGNVHMPLRTNRLRDPIGGRNLAIR